MIQFKSTTNKVLPSMEERHIYPMESKGKGHEVAVATRILQEIRAGDYRYAEKLPRECVLAERLSISRTQLRDSLAKLEREGFISRRQGVGTVINRHVFDLKVRMDQEVEFLDMIAQSGYQPGLAFVKAQQRPAGQKTAECLRIPEGSEILAVSRMVTANGQRTIYCEDCLPVKAIRDHSFTQEDLEKPIFYFLKRFCSIELYMDLAEVRAVVADEELAKLFGVPGGTPLLSVDEVDFDIDGKPVLCAKQYYIDGVIKHTLMRRKF